MSSRKRVALIGASTRAVYAYAMPLLSDYQDTHEVVAVFDIDPRRVRVVNEFLDTSIPGYANADRMFQEARPDLVIISTIDAAHVDYIEKAFEYDVDCVCEKPLCTTAEHCRRIRAAQASHPNVHAVTSHNYRYSPFAMQVKSLLEAGKVGRIRSIIFQERLDQRHGASYFRRWNRLKKNSGGLLVHKASHCFDLLNWFVGSRAKGLIARGSLTAYGPGASRVRGERCHTCEHAQECPQYTDISTGHLRSMLYFQSREPGAYTPDLCLFDPEIDIEDHATVAYSYENGVQVTFDLCAYAAYEGIDLVIEGSEGRLEFHEGASTRWMLESGQHGLEETTGKCLRLCGFDRPVEDIPVQAAEGGHGGADPRLMDDLFGSDAPSFVQASLEDGIQAALIGAAANISIAQGRAVDVQALLEDR